MLYTKTIFHTQRGKKCDIMAKNVVILLTAVLLASSLMVFIPMTSEDVSADSSFTITDVDNKTVSFDRPADYVISLGLGTTLTLIELGMKDKIMGVDTYSSPDYASNAIYKDQLGGLVDFGNYFTLDGRNAMLTKMVQEISNNTAKYEGKSIMFLANNYSYIISDTGLLKNIETKGLDYKVVKLAKSGMTYNDAINFVENVAKVVGASGAKSVADMRYVEEEVKKVVDAEDLSGATAIHISSAATPTVYNTSILLSMVDIAGGTNAGAKGDAATHTTDYPGIIQMIEASPNAVIFIDSGNALSAAEYKEKLGNISNLIVKLPPSFNNTCPSITDGLWMVASALYPDNFSGDVPSAPDSGSDDNLFIYLAAGLAVVVIVLAAVFLYLRRS